MKHGKTPTVAQKILIAGYKHRSKNLNPDNWMVVKNLPDELVIKNRNSNSIIHIAIDRKRCPYKGN
ncbi:hypothetical protein LY28_00040 [Ruminiclostridium sufflavum DSM 19573]|uniref:DUF6906 domain-containing protein n=1 Tax=Ruminiclostridium sufflavum DSM 19573 TaxID=1121337 RepID=A0A318XU50_9FIRM|nr:hypothetical protein [Ruminiclostridium sufflavum]PYG90160.1 hypothetical protein LY28_00040 [Ruminiclostridium sufflavum DSM 19573]